ncbi:MAG: M23 family metallopeptidase [Microbacteriaceae bacterium]
MWKLCPKESGWPRCTSGGLALSGVVLGGVVLGGAVLAAVLLGSGSATAAEAPPPQVVQVDTWSWPVAAPWQILRGFEAPADVYSRGHRGLDLRAASGSPVYAAAAGVVSFAGQVVDRPVVSISHPNDLISSIEPVQPTVTAGQPITRGQQIGTVAAGGHCSGTCAHFGVRLHGQYISPLLFLGGVPRAVLLPLRD